MGLSKNLVWRIKSNLIFGNCDFKNILFVIFLVLGLLIAGTSGATKDIRESRFYTKNETSISKLSLNPNSTRDARYFFPESGRNYRAEKQMYSSELLREIKSIDHMGCFPKVLCGLSVGVDTDKTFGLSKNTFVRNYLELMNDMKPPSKKENEDLLRTQDEVEQELLWPFSPHNPDRKQEYSFEKVGSAANSGSVELEDDSHEYNSGDFDSRVAAADSLMSMELTDRVGLGSGIASKLAGKIKRKQNRKESITSKIASYFTSWLPEISVKTSGRKRSSAPSVPSHVIESFRALVRKQEQELQRQRRTEDASIEGVTATYAEAHDDVQTDGLNIYQTAVKVGKRLRDTKQCDYIYNGCPMDYNKILGMIRNIQTGNEPVIDELEFDSSTTTTTTTKKPRISTKHDHEHGVNKVNIISGLLGGSKNEDSDESSGSSAQPKETAEFDDDDDDSHESFTDDKENKRKEYLITKQDIIASEPSDDEMDRTEVLKVEHHRHGPDPDKPSIPKRDSLSLQIPQLKLSGIKLSTSYSEEEPQSLEISHSSITMKQPPLSLDMSSLLSPNLASSTLHKFPSTKTSSFTKSPYNGFSSSYAKLNDLLTNGGSVQGSLGSLFKPKAKENPENPSKTTTANPATTTITTTDRILLSGIQETLTFDTDEITDDTVQKLGERDLVPVWLGDDDSSASESGDSSTESDEEREILKNLNKLFLNPQNDVGSSGKKSKVQYKNPKKKNAPVTANSSSVRNKNRNSLKNKANFSGSGSQEMSSESDSDRVVIKHSSPTVYQSPLKGPGPHGGAYPYLAGIGRKPSVSHGYPFWRL